MVRSALVRVAAVAALVFLVQPGTASALTYNWTSGTVTLSATAGANVILAPVSVPMDGVFVEFDDSGAGSLIDFLVTIPTTPLLALTQPYGGFDEFVIESADLSPGAGFTNLFNQNLGGGVYSVLATPLDANGVYSAYDSTMTNTPVVGVSVPFTDNSSINGTVNIMMGTLELTGITLAHLPAAFFPGEIDDLDIKADLFFTGVVPEPATGLLIGLSIAAALAARRKFD